DSDLQLTDDEGSPVTPDSYIFEGDTVRLAGSFTDPGILDWHTVEIDWGDQSEPTLFTLESDALSFSALNEATSHRYRDNPANNEPYTITVTVTDKDGASSTAQTTVTVVNATPVITESQLVLSSDHIKEGQTVTLSGSVSFFDRGPDDTHKLV